MVYTVPEVERITRVAAKIAMGRRKKLTSVDKHNVLACSRCAPCTALPSAGVRLPMGTLRRLWRKTVSRVVAEEFPEITLDHQYVDAAAMHMVPPLLPSPAPFGGPPIPPPPRSGSPPCTT